MIWYPQDLDELSVHSDECERASHGLVVFENALLRRNRRVLPGEAAQALYRPLLNDPSHPSYYPKAWSGYNEYTYSVTAIPGLIRIES